MKESAINIVPKYYTMNPNTEDLLFDATKLRNGMEVLVETSALKADTKEMHYPNIREQAMKWNRWCIVTELMIDEEADEVLFIGVYADRTKQKLVTSADYAWFVKKDEVEFQEAAQKIDHAETVMWNGIETAIDRNEVKMDQRINEFDIVPIERF